MLKSGLQNAASVIRSTVRREVTIEFDTRTVVLDAEPFAEGGFCTVYLARDVNNYEEQYALKWMVAQEKSHLKDFMWEIDVHRRLAGHPHIMGLCDHLVRPSEKIDSRIAKDVLLLYPLSRGGSLFDGIERGVTKSSRWPFPEKVAVRLFLEACEAVRYMHKKGLAHRDIKPHNVLLFDYDQETGQPSERMIPILMDLGSTAQLKVQVRTRKDVLNLQDLAASKCSPPYRAPELTEVQLDVDVDGRSDVFSLGGTLFAMAFGHSPFEHRTQGFMKLALLNGNAPFPEDRCSPYGNEYSIEFCDLITCMLRPNPSKRYKLSKVLRHVKNLLNQ